MFSCIKIIIFILVGSNKPLRELAINPAVENMGSTATLIDGIHKYSFAKRAR